MEPKNVMIIGGGIAGMTAAQELAEAGLNVDLVEKSGFLGGHAIQYTCKATSECLHCGACSVEKMLKDVVENDKINVHLSTEIESITKSNGYSIKLNKSEVFIDAEKCTNCGICYDKLKESDVIMQGYSKNNMPLYAVNSKKIDENRTALKEICPESAISISDTAATEDLILLPGEIKWFSAVVRKLRFLKNPKTKAGKATWMIMSDCMASSPIRMPP